MANLGWCYAQGRGVGQDLAEAVRWYRQGAEAGDETAVRRLWVIHAVNGLMTRVDGDSEADAAWARDQSRSLRPGLWADTPPLTGKWREITDAEARACLARLRQALLSAEVASSLEGARCRAIRGLPLSFYPDCTLLDLQFEWPDTAASSPSLMSAIVGPAGAVVLDYRSDLIQAINHELLRVDDEDAARDYLRFFCGFVAGDEGPFHIVEESDAIPILGDAQDSLPEDLQNAIVPMRALGEHVETHGYQRFDACILYSNALFKSTLKLFPSGLIEMEGEEPIASDLPIHVRRYDGPFRTLDDTVSTC